MDPAALFDKAQIDGDLGTCLKLFSQYLESSTPLNVQLITSLRIYYRREQHNVRRWLEKQTNTGNSQKEIEDEYNNVIKQVEEGAEAFLMAKTNPSDSWCYQSFDFLQSIQPSTGILAARLYSYKFDGTLNAVCDGTYTGKEEPILRQIITDLDSLIEQCPPLNDPVVLYRGSQTRPKMISPRYTSLTMLLDVAESYLTDNSAVEPNPNGVVMKVILPTGTKCLAQWLISSSPGEGEILMSRKTQFRLVKEETMPWKGTGVSYQMLTVEPLLVSLT